jgi:hypothetical protein
VFTLTLAQTSTAPVTVSYMTASESALSGFDFGSTSGFVTFNAGTATQTVTVPILGDLLVEADETFSLNFSGSPLLTRSFARGTILNDDSTNVIVAPMLGGVSRSNQWVHLTWNTTDGLTYRVEYKDDLNELLWQTIQPPISGNGSSYTFVDVTATNVPQRFYRVTVE